LPLAHVHSKDAAIVEASGISNCCNLCPQIALNLTFLTDSQSSDQNTKMRELHHPMLFTGSAAVPMRTASSKQCHFLPPETLGKSPARRQSTARIWLGRSLKYHWGLSIWCSLHTVRMWTTR